MSRLFLTSLIAVAAVALCMPSSLAQQLEVVYVTAQKREQTLEDVPISITAISGAEIEAAHIGNIDQLQTRIPNFRMSTAAVSTEIYIRGVGSDANDGFEQSVGMFVDGIYGGRGRQFRAPFLDLERLEVLRGPQGVLLGKNTIAGAVNVTTNRPTSEFSGSLTGSYNSALGEKRGTLIVTGPIAGGTRGRLAAMVGRSDGYLRNSIDGQTEPAIDEVVVRGILERDFGESVTARLKYEFGQFDRDGSPFVINDVGPFGDVFESFDPDFSREAYVSSKGGLGGEKEFDDTDTSNAALQIDWDLPGHTFTAVSGFSGFRFERRLDSDFSPIPMLLTETLPERFEQLSQELRLLSDPGSTLDYIVGLYWQTSTVDTLRQTQIDGDTLADLLLGPLMNPLGAAAVRTTGKTFQKFDQESDSLAAYGQLTWNLSDEFRATVGLRYSKEEKDAVQFVILQNLDGTLNTDDVGIALTGLLFGFTNHYFQDTRTESDVSPSFSLQWDMSDTAMVYGTAASGFKAGGYNAQERGDDIALFEFEEEKATTLEIGTKLTLLGGAARLGASAFHSNYDDRQVSTFNGVTFVVGNAAKSTSKGLELDGAWALTDEVEIGGSMAWLDSSYDSFPDGPCFAGDTRDECTDISSIGARDLSGETTSYAPEYSGHLYARGRTPLHNNLELSWGVDFTYTDGFFYSADLDPADFQEAYTLLDARVAVGPEDGRWQIALVGQNLTEEIINGGYGADIPLLTGAHFSTSIPPRRVTLSGTIHFGN